MTYEQDLLLKKVSNFTPSQAKAALPYIVFLENGWETQVCEVEELRAWGEVVEKFWGACEDPTMIEHPDVCLSCASQPSLRARGLPRQTGRSPL